MSSTLSDTPDLGLDAPAEQRPAVRPLPRSRVGDDSIPLVVGWLSNSWLWIGIGLLTLWLMSAGG